MARRARQSLLAFLAIGLASPAFAQETISFAAFGDYGNGPGANAVAALVKGRTPDFIMSVGDNCYGGIPIATQVGNKYDTFVQEGRFFAALGNHEYSDKCGGPGAANFLSYFTFPNNERYYDFVRGPVHFFVLNSNNIARETDGRTATSIQGEWIKARIAASTSPWQVVISHHPPFSSGKHGPMKPMRWPYEAWGVDAVLSGDEHSYERIVRDDNANGVKLPYLIVGLGGQKPRPITRNIKGSESKYWADYGALFVTASSTALSFEFRNTSDAIIDTYSITQSAAPSATGFDFKVCC